MITRPGMSCTDNDLTDAGMHAGSANDRPAFGWSEDSVDPYSAVDLMGASTWLDYVERWNPLRWVPQRKTTRKTRNRRSA